MDVCTTEEVKLKSYFYALRTALAGKWIVENNSFPPVAFTDLLPIAPLLIQEKVRDLMQLKANQNEGYLHPKEVLICDFLIKMVRFNEEGARGLRSGKKIGDELDGVFINWVMKI